MEIIKKLSDMIKEEIGDASKYAKCALVNKDSDKILSDTFYTLANEELKHMDMLHAQVTRILTSSRVSTFLVRRDVGLPGLVPAPSLHRLAPD